MAEVTKRILSALQNYATVDPNIKDELTKLVNELDTDLDAADYHMSPETESAITTFDERVTELDNVEADTEHTTAAMDVDAEPEPPVRP